MTKKCEKMSTFEGGRCSSSNQAQSTGNSILDDFRPSRKKWAKSCRNEFSLPASLVRASKVYVIKSYTFSELKIKIGHL